MNKGNILWNQECERYCNALNAIEFPLSVTAYLVRYNRAPRSPLPPESLSSFYGFMVFLPNSVNYIVKRLKTSE